MDFRSPSIPLFVRRVATQTDSRRRPSCVGWGSTMSPLSSTGGSLSDGPDKGDDALRITSSPLPSNATVTDSVESRLLLRCGTCACKSLCRVRTVDQSLRSAKRYRPYLVCPCELVFAPRFLLQVSLSISRWVISSVSRSLSSQLALGCFLSSCVTLLGVGVERRQFDNFRDRSKVWLESLVVWTAHSHHFTTYGGRCDGSGSPRP